MEYTNDKIRKLINERDAIVDKYNNEIQNEIQKEKARYKFSYKRFSLSVLAVGYMVLAVEINEHLFPKTSIWSWQYYIKDNK